jgi:hypothetical protein
MPKEECSPGHSDVMIGSLAFLFNLDKNSSRASTNAISRAAMQKKEKEKKG